jgi:Asp/Glu/hydantoin racemase
MTALALIHTTPVVIPTTNAVSQLLMPSVRIVNYLDDAIVGDIFKANEITDGVRHRLCHLGRAAADANADAILVTCSSISETVSDIAEASCLPVYKIDEAMAEEAVRVGTRIGVIATLPTTMEPTCRLVASKAAAAGKRIELHKDLEHEAYKQLSQGNSTAHDRILREALRKLSPIVDVIVLAQASMARLLDAGDVTLSVPVLASPRPGFARVQAKLRERGLNAD